MKNYTQTTSPRRKFLGALSAAFGFVTLSSAKGNSPLLAQQGHEAEAWMNKLKGKHKMVFDTITPINGFQIVWPFNFLESSNETGTPDSELGTMVVLRGKAISIALEDRLWKKYKLGKFYGVNDPTDNTSAECNLYWNPEASHLPEPGSSIKDLMARGVLFGVCERALAMNAGQIAKNKGLDPAEVKKDLFAGILPGIQRVPSGVWAINRAQENGASYCWAG